MLVTLLPKYSFTFAPSLLALRENSICPYDFIDAAADTGDVRHLATSYHVLLYLHNFCIFIRLLLEIAKGAEC